MDKSKQQSWLYSWTPIEGFLLLSHLPSPNCTAKKPFCTQIGELASGEKGSMEAKFHATSQQSRGWWSPLLMMTKACSHESEENNTFLKLKLGSHSWKISKWSSEIHSPFLPWGKHWCAFSTIAVWKSEIAKACRPWKTCAFQRRRKQETQKLLLDLNWVRG